MSCPLCRVQEGKAQSGMNAQLFFSHAPPPPPPAAAGAVLGVDVRQHDVDQLPHNRHAAGGAGPPDRRRLSPGPARHTGAVRHGAVGVGLGVRLGVGAGVGAGGRRVMGRRILGRRVLGRSWGGGQVLGRRVLGRCVGAPGIGVGFWITVALHARLLPLFSPPPAGGPCAAVLGPRLQPAARPHRLHRRLRGGAAGGQHTAGGGVGEEWGLSRGWGVGIVKIGTGKCSGVDSGRRGARTDDRLRPQVQRQRGGRCVCVCVCGGGGGYIHD